MRGLGKSRGESSVPAPYLAFLVVAAEENEIDGDALLAAAQLSREQVHELEGRVAWRKLLALVTHLHTTSPPEQRRAIFRSFVRDFPAFRVIAEAATSARELLLLTMEVTFPAFPAIRWEVSELDDGPIELRLEVDRDHASARALFESIALSLASLSPALGFGEVAVEAEIQGECAVVRLHAPGSALAPAPAIPPARSLAELVSTVRLALGPSPERDVPAGGAQGRGLTLALQSAFGLTRAEARVVARLARGLSPREIASELGVAVETVRSHLKRSYAKVGVRGQAELVASVVRLPPTLKSR